MRGEGNHKIPGSFAPENMEKTGAERVKYSLACQHEDAIPIKFVSYALKCPTVLCTFAVALRKESVDRNVFLTLTVRNVSMSLSARRAWIEIYRNWRKQSIRHKVALRKESVDRNIWVDKTQSPPSVALRKESVDRNLRGWTLNINGPVALRKESVDRNGVFLTCMKEVLRRSPQGERG